MRLLVAVLLCTLSTACVDRAEVKRSAETNAMNWCEAMAIDCVGVSCSASDSDADGYTSCTANTSTGARVPIECGYTQALALLGQNTGCKEVRPINFHDGAQ